jgi:hypothetical protein
MNHSNQVLALKGMAIDLQVVADFHLRLEQNPFLGDIKLVRSEVTTINGVPVFTFDITASTSFADSTLLTDGLEPINLPPREKLVQLVSAAAPNLAQSMKDDAAEKKAL